MADIASQIDSVPLVNANTNKIEAVPQDQVGQALSSGTHNLQAGQDFNILDPDGKLISLPTTQVPSALQNGYSIPQQSHLTDFKMQQTYGEGLGNEAKTFGTAAANAASFGAFNQIAVRGGLETAEAVQQREQRNPISNVVGSLAGVGAALAIPGVGEAEAIGEATVAAKAAGLSEEGVQAAASAAARAFRAGDLVNPVQGLAKVGNAVTDYTSDAILSQLGNSETSPIVAKILGTISPVAAKTLGSAVEGSVYGLGQSVGEQVLGDPNYNAENILHNVGYGALYGGALGTFFGIAEGGYGALRSKFGKDIADAAAKEAIIEDAALPSRITSTPTTVAEMNSRLQGYGEGNFEELAPKAQILEGEQILAGDSQFPVTARQTNSFNSPYERIEYLTGLKKDDPLAHLEVKYEGAQKAEAQKELIPRYISEIAPDFKPTGDAVEAGEQVENSAKTVISAGEKRMGPLFDYFNEKASTVNAPTGDILKSIDGALPGASKMIQENFDAESLYKGEPKYSMTPYDASLGITKQAYSAVKEIVTALNKKEGLNLSGIRNLRKVISQDIEKFSDPVAKSQVGALKTSLMDMMQDGVERGLSRTSPEELANSPFKDAGSVRQLFKDYAVLQENKKTVESILGGDIGHYTKLMDKPAAERSLQRIFRDTNAVKAMRGILGPEEWNKTVANYLKMNIEKATDSTTGKFSARKFSTFLNSNKEAVLDEALAQNPVQLQKLRAIARKIGNLSDTVPVNPSGTADVLEHFKKSKFFDILTSNSLTELPGKFGKLAYDTYKSGRAVKEFNASLAKTGAENPEDVLASKMKKYGVFAKIERMQQQTASTIDRGVNAILKGGDAIAGIAAQKLIPHEESLKEYNKLQVHLGDMTNDSTHIDALNNATQPLLGITPQIVGSLNMATGAATQFLQSKLPNQGQSSPLTPPYEVSKSELARFNRYAQTVKNPLHVLEQMRAGNLTTESLETLHTVYPKLLEQMQGSIVNKLDAKAMAKMPYQSKIMLSAFLGQDLSNSLSQPNILSAQIQSAPQTPGPTAPRPKTSVGPSQKGLGKLDSSTHFMTPMQQALSRTER